MRNTKIIALLSALTLCAGLLTACGEKKTEEAQATTAPRTTQSAPVSTQPAETKAVTTAAPEPAETESAAQDTTVGKLFPEKDTPSFTLPSHAEANGGEAETQPSQPESTHPSQPSQPGDPTSPTQERPASGENLTPVDSNENLPANP